MKPKQTTPNHEPPNQISTSTPEGWPVCYLPKEINRRLALPEMPDERQDRRKNRLPLKTRHPA